MDVKALQSRLRAFAAARDWQSFHAPKNLAMALVVEAAELLELFQWSTLTESRGFVRDARNKERVADEIADVLLYLVQLADHTDVDLEEAVAHKLRKNADKYPPRHPEPPPAAPAPAAPAAPRVHLLVDWENVQPQGEELRRLIPESTEAWLFHGPQQSVDDASHQRVFGPAGVTRVPRSGVGKNALDFQLTYYVGYITARQPDARFIVISNDKGYDPMLEHARGLGFQAERRAFARAQPAHEPKACAPTPVVVAKKKTASKATPASAKATRAQVQQFVRLLDGMATEQRPADEAGLRTLLRAQLGVPGMQSPAVTHALSQLRAQKHLVIKDGRVSYPPAQIATPAAAKAAAPTPATPKPPAAKTAPRTAAQIALAVLASLKKMPKNKPTRRAGLLKHIETHATRAADPKAMAQQVCALLEARKDVLVAPADGAVSYPKLDAGNSVQPESLVS